MKNTSVKFVPLGGAGEIGANSYYIEYNNKSFLIDCGSDPRKEGFNQFTDLDKVKIKPEYIFISHAHHDHIGSLPFTIKKYPDIKLVATRETFDIAKVMLIDSENIFKRNVGMSYDLDFKFLMNKTTEKIEAEYTKTINISKDMSVTYYRAGHILGAAMILFKFNNMNMLYTGDFMLHDSLTVYGAKSEHFSDIDVIISESTYGNKFRTTKFIDSVKQLQDYINNICENGGSILFPAFSLGRSQELLSAISFLKQKKLICNNLPVYISGLTNKINKIYKNYSSLIDLGDITKLNVKTMNKKANIFNVPSLFIASSGMMKEGTASHEIARYIADNNKNAIIFPGYVAEEEIGYRLITQKNFVLKYAKNVTVPIKASVKRIDFSAHASANELIDFVKKINPTVAVLVHGSKNNIYSFKENIKNTIKNVYFPESNGEIIHFNKKNKNVSIDSSALCNAAIITVGTSIIGAYNNSLKTPSKVKNKKIDFETLIKFVCKNPKKHSAELNTLLNISEDKMDKTFDYYLVSSDATAGNGKLCAEIIKEYLIQKKYKVVEISEIEGLTTDSNEFKNKGLPNFINRIIQIIEAYSDSVILATGGFKATTAFAALIGATFKIPVFYIHEDFKSENPVIEMPFCPLNYDFTEFHQYAVTIDELCAIENQEIASGVYDELPDSLKNLIIYSEKEERYKLTPVGLVSQKAYKHWKNVYEAKLRHIVVLEKLPNLWRDNIKINELTYEDIIIPNFKKIIEKIIKISGVKSISMRKIEKFENKLNALVYVTKKRNAIYYYLCLGDYKQKIKISINAVSGNSIIESIGKLIIL